jgi:hypothetical protein
MADNDRAPWQTPSITAVTDTGARADQATARIRNGAVQDGISQIA